MRYVDGGHVAAAILKQRDIRYAVATLHTMAICIRICIFVVKEIVSVIVCLFP